MGILTRAVLWRWLARWLMRGSPLTVVAKLAAVGAIGAWRYKRRRSAESRDPDRIEAEYEVLGPERIAPVAHASREPRTRPEGTGPLKIDDDSRAST